jgi:hypothetical protein
MYVVSDMKTFILATCAPSITSDTCRFVNVSADAKGKVQPLGFYARKSIVVVTVVMISSTQAESGTNL